MSEPELSSVDCPFSEIPGDHAAARTAGGGFYCETCGGGGERSLLVRLTVRQEAFVGSDGALGERSENFRLPPRRPQAPSLPLEMLPEDLRPWVADTSERMQVSPELIAAPALVALGAVVGRRMTIQPLSRDSGWQVTPNLWGAVVAPPSAKKSPAQREALAPLQAVEDTLLEKQEEDRPRLAARKLAAEQKVAAIRDQIKRSYRPGSKQDPARLEASLATALSELEEASKEAQPERLMINDATVEKLHELLGCSPKGLLQCRDELAGWLQSLEREDRKTDRAFYLETWAGDGRFTVDRIGRGTVRAQGLCLSLFGGIQPARVEPLVRSTIRDGGDGLLQRMQVLVWPEVSRDWKLVDRPPDARDRQPALDLYERLGQMRSESEARKFDDQGQEVFYAWLQELEEKLLSPELSSAPAFVSHLAKYRSLMPSIALLFHLASDRPDRQVSAEAARFGAAWCEFLEKHARKLYAPELFPGREAAYVLAAKIRSGAVSDRMSLRDIHHKGWRGLTSADDLEAAAELLASYGSCSLETVQPATGRPSRILRLSETVS